MAREVICDQCGKKLKSNQSIYFSNTEKNLDFCSEDCYSKWNSNNFDWKDIHPDFTLELQTKWINKGFNKLECKEWLSIGLQSLDYDFCAWLKNIIQETPENLLNYDDKRILQEQYQEFLKNTKVSFVKNKKLTPSLFRKWQNKNFSDEEIQLWIDAGLRIQDFGYASWLRDTFKMTPLEYLDLNNNDYDELLWDEYKEHLQSYNSDTFTETTQEFLELNYPKEKRKKVETIDLTNKQIEGELILTNFPNLKKILLSNNAISKLRIENCPNLKEIDVSNNYLSEIDLSQLTHLELLHCTNNKLHKLDVSQNKNLKTLFCFGNNLTEIEGVSSLSKLERFYGDKSLQSVKSILLADGDWGLKFSLLKMAKEQINSIIRERIDNKKTSLEELNYYLKSENSNHIKFSAWRAISCQQDVYGNVWLLDKNEKQRIVNTFEVDNFETLATIIVDIMQERGNFQGGEEKIRPVLNQILSLREQLNIAQDKLSSSQGSLLILEESQKNNLQNDLEVEELLNSNLQNNPTKDLIIAQEWLDKNYPKESRKEIDRLTIKNENLLGHLDLSDFVNLKILEIWEPAVNSLNIEKNEKLNYFFSFDNLFWFYKLQIKENARKIFYEKFRSMGPMVSYQAHQVGDEEIDEFFKRIITGYNTDNYSPSPYYIFMTISKEDLIDYLRGLPDKVEIEFNFQLKREGVIRILWRAYQIENMPLIALKNLSESSILPHMPPNLPRAVILQAIIKFFSAAPPRENESRLLREALREQIIFDQRVVKQWKDKLDQEDEKRKKITEFVEKEEYLLPVVQSKSYEVIGTEELKREMTREAELSNWEFRTKSIMPIGQTSIKPNLKEFVGKGGYSEVYHGEWKAQDVAVKKIYLSLKTSESEIKDIRKEIDILKDLRNRHIIQYYGFYFDNRELFIIMDYAEKGTLTKFINDNKNKEHDWELNSDLIKQITLGLIYIHHENIVHRDLKSMNILLTNNYQVKISDFGLSKVKIISSSQLEGDVVGTLRWMAPELIKSGKYSEQSDIYALGMVIWEIVARNTKPFENFDNNLLANHIMKGGKETVPNDTPQNIRTIIERCWKDNPNERINLVNILEAIKSDRLNFQTTYTDQSLEISNLPESQNNQEISEFWSPKSIEFNLEGLQKVLEEMDEQVWTNIDSGFTLELVQSWQELGFTYNQVQDWINTGLQPTDLVFVTWLKNTKHLTPEQVLNNGNEAQLRAEFQTYQTELKSPQKNSPQLTNINKKIEEKKREMNYFKESHNLAELVVNFIEVNKKVIKNEEDEQARKEVKELYKKMEDQGLTEEEIEKIIRHCEELVSLELEKELLSKNDIEEEFQVKIEIPPK